MGAVKNFYHDEICAAEYPDEPDVEVCANCGAYFDGRFNPTKWQRCAKCRAGLEASAMSAGTAATTKIGAGLQPASAVPQADAQGVSGND